MQREISVNISVPDCNEVKTALAPVAGFRPDTDSKAQIRVHLTTRAIEKSMRHQNGLPAQRRPQMAQMQGMMLHRGGYEVTRQELDLIQLPAETDS